MIRVVKDVTILEEEEMTFFVKSGLYKNMEEIIINSKDTSNDDPTPDLGGWKAVHVGLTVHGNILLVWDEVYGILFNKDFTITGGEKKWINIKD